MELQQLREHIASAKANEAGAFEALFGAFAPRLYGYFFRATGHHHDAEDLLGELWLRLLRSLKNYDDRGRFEPWLFRIAANMVRDRIRWLKTNPGATSLSGDDDTGGGLADGLSGDCPAADADLQAVEMGESLRAALEKLDVQTRQIILLRHFGELSFKEIAEICQCPIGTALARMHRGLRTLRRLMGERDGTE